MTIMRSEKKCSDCQTIKPVAEFHRNRSSRDGFTYVCRACTSVRQRAKYEADRDRILERGRQWREANRERDLAAKRRRYRANREAAAANNRKNKLRRIYNLSEADYDHLVSIQGGACAICRAETVERLHVDHDHQTGKVRGLLCSPCNRGIGHLNDSPTTLLAAVAYLIESGTADPGDQYVTCTLRDLIALITGEAS